LCCFDAFFIGKNRLFSYGWMSSLFAPYLNALFFAYKNALFFCLLWLSFPRIFI